MFIYYFNDCIQRIFINGSKYSRETQFLNDSEIKGCIELVNGNLLFWLQNELIYIIQNTFPMKKVLQMRKRCDYICQVSDKLFLFVSYQTDSFRGSYLVNIETNKEIQKYDNLLFINSFKLEKENKIILISQVKLICYNISTLEIETIFDIDCGIHNFSLSPENKGIGFATTFNNECIKINLKTFQYQQYKFSPEQGKIYFVLALPYQRILIESDEKVKMFRY